MLGYLKKVTKTAERKDEAEPVVNIDQASNTDLTLARSTITCTVTSTSNSTIELNTNTNDQFDVDELTKGCKRRSIFKRINFLPPSCSTNLPRNNRCVNNKCSVHRFDSNDNKNFINSDHSANFAVVEFDYKKDNCKNSLPMDSATTGISQQNHSLSNTLCPTIASALWRPLWPPGWYPRSSSGAAMQSGTTHPNSGFTSSISTSGTSTSSTNSRMNYILNNNESTLPTSLPVPTNDEENYPTISANKMSKTSINNNNKHKNVKNSDLSINKNIERNNHKEFNGNNNNDNNNDDNYLNKSGKYEIFAKEDYEKIEDWLDEHPEFVHSYVVRKASRSVIDKWLLAHSSSMCTVGTLYSNSNLAGNENSGANTPVRKISAHEFEASGGGYLRPMVSTTCDGTLTFLPIKDTDTSGDVMAKNRLSKETTPTLLKPDEQTSNKSRQLPISLMSREELKTIKDEKELIFELVKDICNDLDVKSLCHKILKNVSILTNADRCSLFLVRGEKFDPKTRCLVSQLFDVCGQSTIEQISQKEEIIIPWGTGIVGYVAESGNAVNIPDCYQDIRFTNIIDIKTGYRTQNMLCNPIFDFDGEVMGVAQVINKKNSKCFDKNDENVFAKYLQFCGIGLRNAQIYERSQLENKRNQVLLDLARMIFEKQSNIENIIYRILIHVLSLMQCERCQIMLLTDESADSDLYYYGRSYQESDFCLETSQLRVTKNIDGTHSECTSSNASTTSELSLCGELFNNKTFTNQIRSFYRVFDLQAADLQQPDFEKSQQTPFEGRFPINIGITGYVATTGETLNIPDAYADSRFDQIVDCENGFQHKSILCMPIRNAARNIIGVIQLVNKLNGQPFNKNDENLLEAFGIFSGIGIQNTKMYEKAVRAMAKQKVTLELLSYHASANDEEASKFARMLIPSTNSLSLSSLRFDDFSLSEDQMIKACIRMFIDLDLIERFQIDYKVLCKWILSVRKNYRKVLYHNWRHAFNVAQMMFAIFVNTDICLVLGELETLALIVACICHDLDHRGTNNSFQIKTSSPLAQLYSTSTLEHHHFDQSLMILNSQGNQILSNLSPEEYHRVVNVLEEAILATDLAIYFQKKNQFFEIIDEKKYDWNNEQHRSLLRSMLMTSCDIAAITKPWEIQRRIAELVANEFYQQGDIEKEQLNIEPIDMMNREKEDELPKMQMSFIDTICLPIYEAFAKLCPQQLSILHNGVVSNREAWNLLSIQPYQITIQQKKSAASNDKTDD